MPSVRVAAALAAGLLTLASPQGAAAGQKVPADELMQDLRGGGKVLLPAGSVVTGELLLEDGDYLTAKGVTFAGPVSTPPEPMGTRTGSLILSESHFKDTAIIAGLSFGTFDCSRCTFDRDADFHSIVVDRMVLDRAVFKGAAGFITATFGRFDLRDTRFDKGASFAAARIEEFHPARLQTGAPIVIAWDQFNPEWAEGRRAVVFDLEKGDEDRDRRAAQLREEFRFWRRNFDDLEVDEDAREANYALVKLERREDFGVLKPNTWAPYVLALASGYGTDPYRPFWMAVLAVAIFAAIFWPIGFQKTTNTSTTVMAGRFWPVFAIGFSVQTFVPFLTIPGIKDSDWELRCFWWLEPVEGVIGVLVFGFAAYSAAVTL
jgi:hypothetical protein